MGLRSALRRLRPRAFDRSGDGEQRVENVDAMAAAAGSVGRTDPQGGTGHSGAPPGYVKADDGRPRH
jgi:hypothetical protein